MTQTIHRMYDSAERAQQAAHALQHNRFIRFAEVHCVGPDAGGQDAIVQSLMQACVLKAHAQGVPPGSARMFIRPHDLILREPGHATLEGRVTAMRRFGPTRRVDLALDVNGEPLPVEAVVPVGVALTVGQPIGLALERYRLFKE